MTAAAAATPGIGPGPARAAPDLDGWPSTVLAGLADGLRAWARYRRLRAMGDGGLARLGLARADIVRHALLGDGAAPPRPPSGHGGDPDGSPR